jgi:hypothetical protein
MKNNIVIKIILYSIVSSALIVGYVLGFIFLKNKSQDVANREASISSQINQIEQSLDDKKQSESVSKISTAINQHFLKSSEVPSFLSSLEEIGGRTGSIININSVDESGSGNDSSLNLAISANGSYQAIYRTLIELENLPYLSSITNLSLSFSQNSVESFDFTKKPSLQSSWSLTAKLVIKSYYK